MNEYTSERPYQKLYRLFGNGSEQEKQACIEAMRGHNGNKFMCGLDLSNAITEFKRIGKELEEGSEKDKYRELCRLIMQEQQRRMSI